MNKAAIFLKPALKTTRVQALFALDFSLVPSRVDSPSLTGCIASLQSCAQLKDLERGKQLHTRMLVCGYLNSSPLSTTSLINMYSKCSNSISDARSLFLTSPLFPNVFTFNAIIAGLVAHNLPKQASHYYHKMLATGILPDKFTIPCVIKACLSIVDVKRIHGLVLKLGLEVDLYIASALVRSYLEFGDISLASEVFAECPQRNDVVICNALINGTSHIGEHVKAMMVFRTMMEDGVTPDRFTLTGILSVLTNSGDGYNGRLIHGFAIKMGLHAWVAVLNALVDMYGKCRHVIDAIKVFELIIEKDIFSWNSIMCVQGQCGDHEETLTLFKRMLRSGIKPDLVTVTTVLPACGHLAALMHGKEIHGYMIVNCLWTDHNNFRECDNAYVDNIILDMYAKCGSMTDAWLVFNNMKYKDVASWNILINGYGIHGFGWEALDVFSCMCKANVKPNEVTFLGLLSACCHAGLLTKGQELLAQMYPRYGVVPSVEHYTCVVDMLGRSGLLEDAYQLLSTMPVQANSVTWGAFLAGCHLHGNAELAEIAARKVLELKKEQCGSYVTVSNMYGAAGRFEEATELRSAMKGQSLMKTPGCSWIELGNGVHGFDTDKRTHDELDLRPD